MKTQSDPGKQFYILTGAKIHTLRKKVVSSVTTCSRTDDKSIFRGDSAMVAKACHGTVPTDHY
jgi:hypothetical protein